LKDHPADSAQQTAVLNDRPTDSTMHMAVLNDRPFDSGLETSGFEPLAMWFRPSNCRLIVIARMIPVCNQQFLKDHPADSAQQTAVLNDHPIKFRPTGRFLNSRRIDSGLKASCFFKQLAHRLNRSVLEAMGMTQRIALPILGRRLRPKFCASWTQT
jgi:hypothetical protein